MDPDRTRASLVLRRLSLCTLFCFFIKAARIYILGNRAWTGFGQCRLCGSFLNPRLGHGETCSTAEATRGHYACVNAVVCGLKLADPGITTEPRVLTASQTRPADIFTTATVPGRSAALEVCVPPPSRSSSRRRTESVTRTLQFAADISRNGQQMSAVNRPHLCSHQASSCPLLPSRGSLLPLCDDFSR